MAKKYYAVAFGREGSGIYTQWDQTERSVKGISGVRYKAFASPTAARAYLLELGVPEQDVTVFGEPSPVREPELPSGPPPAKTRQRVGAEPASPAAGTEPVGANEQPETIYAYVDGSFRQGYDVYGYGVVIVADGQVLKTFSGVGSRPEYVTMRNVAGEILGAVQAMKYALASGAGHIVLYFDYQGIESWAKGTWKRNNDLTRGYHEFVRSLQPRLKITFAKVKGHSGDRYNDLADELARQAVADSRG